MPTQDLDLSAFSAEYKNMKMVRNKFSTYKPERFCVVCCTVVRVTGFSIQPVICS